MSATNFVAIVSWTPWSAYLMNSNCSPAVPISESVCTTVCPSILKEFWKARTGSCDAAKVRSQASR